jgi:hypothetical protein
MHVFQGKADAYHVHRAGRISKDKTDMIDMYQPGCYPRQQFLSTRFIDLSPHVLVNNLLPLYSKSLRIYTENPPYPPYPPNTPLAYTNRALLLIRTKEIQESLNTTFNIRCQINQWICAFISAKSFLSTELQRNIYQQLQKHLPRVLLSYLHCHWG